MYSTHSCQFHLVPARIGWNVPDLAVCRKAWPHKWHFRHGLNKTSNPQFLFRGVKKEKYTNPRKIVLVKPLHPHPRTSRFSKEHGFGQCSPATYPWELSASNIGLEHIHNILLIWQNICCTDMQAIKDIHLEENVYIPARHWNPWFSEGTCFHQM